MRRACLLLAFAGSACATERSASTTWEDDAREGVGRSVRLETLEPEARAQLASPARSLEPEPLVAEELELSLIRFTTKRRAIAADHPVSVSWPRPMEAAFDNVLEELERGFTRPKGTVPRRLLVQARVTLEVELDVTRARFGAAPQGVLDRVGRLFGLVALHMRAAPAPVEERPRGLAGIDLGWPVAPVIITSFFGYRRDPILGRENVRFHAGLDLGGQSGDLIQAAGPGRVVQAGWVGGHGRTVVIQHAGGYQTFYGHLQRILTAIGKEVEAGAAIGFMGSTGRSTGPHLHFEVRRGGVPIDPMDVVDARSTFAAAR